MAATKEGGRDISSLSLPSVYIVVFTFPHPWELLTYK